MPCLPAILSFSYNRPGRALLWRTDACGLFGCHHLIRFCTSVSAIETIWFTNRPRRVPTKGLPSVKTALNPVLLSRLPLIDHLRVGLTIDQTAREHDHAADRSEHRLHQSLLDRHDLRLSIRNPQRVYHHRRYAATTILVARRSRSVKRLDPKRDTLHVYRFTRGRSNLNWPMEYESSCIIRAGARTPVTTGALPGLVYQAQRETSTLSWFRAKRSVRSTQ